MPANPIQQLLRENDRRQKANNALFNPVSGEGSIGQRVKFSIPDYPIPTQWLPVEMMEEPFVKKIKHAGTVEKFIKSVLLLPVTDEAREKVVEQFIRTRIKHDYPFWAATLVYIKNKKGGKDILFRLNRPQRRLIAKLECMRKAGKPIRLIILKARQWGGSTCVQLYMAWLQLVHEIGLNSLIIAHLSAASDRIKSMFDKMLAKYPVELLHNLGEEYNPSEKKMVGVGKSGSIFRVPQRNCEINIGTAESSESSRSGSYNLIHLSEIGLWKKTEKSEPEQIIRAATTGVLYEPYTMIVYESTANGVGFLKNEYIAAKNGESQFEAHFVPTYEIEQYELAITADTLPDYIPVAKGEKPIDAFARWLYTNRESGDVPSLRREPGTYYWWLWNKGATLEAINWYIHERTKFTDHGDMASEYPNDDTEAFTLSGRKVFSSVDVEQFRPACRPPRWRGEVYGHAERGEQAFDNLRFVKGDEGQLFMWADVEKDTPEATVTDRYLVIVDVGKGKTAKADFSDILVLDRLPLMDCEPPTVIAEWHGHIDMDLLAWKAAQVAAYYNNALLVIESNTLETNNTKGEAEYILTLIRDVYVNLYARKQSAEDIQNKMPKKYGFHTNTTTKPVIINNLQYCVREQLYVEREEEALNEMLTYIQTDKGGYEADAGYHDDRLMTRAIGLYVSTHEMEIPRIVDRSADKAATAKFQVVSEASII
jgi:hypothetical protein